MEGLELEMEELDSLVSGEKGLQEEEGPCQSRRSRILSMALVVAVLVLVVLGKSSRNQNHGRVIFNETEGLGEVVAVDDTQKANDEPAEPVATADTQPQEGESAAEAATEEQDENEEEPEEDDEEEDEDEDEPEKNKFPRAPIDRDQLPVSDAAAKELVDTWGQWHFWDGDEDMRPKEDFLAKYPNGDIPGDDFPDESWQVDAVYVNHFLNDADKLIARAKEAIFTEYGKGKPLPPEKLAERLKMFHWEKIDMAATDRPPPEFQKRGKREIGGWTTRRSQDGLVRRLLHAMITQDTFTIVLGGHSAAQGAGNHFRQSYMMQAHRVLRPVFERLGVKLVTRNISNGGMGTIQAAMGSAGIYGDEVDLIIWDSGMTENGAPEHVDLFLRQALIGGKRVPVVWGGHFELLKMLHEEADVDVGENGLGLADMPVTENEEQMKSLPWAYQQMKCADDRQDLCAQRFRVACWIDRPDGIKPEKPQLDRPKGQVKWHPGWRMHQLEGRVIAFAILEALQIAVNTWSEATLTGQPLDDDYWHVTEYYENIRQKVRNLDPSLGKCYKIDGTLPARMCNTPMQGRTQYTPRANADVRSISALIKPASDGYMPRNEKVALYEGPDVHIPDFDVPEGAVDVIAIVENRRRLSQSAMPYHERKVEDVVKNEDAESLQSRRRLDGPIVPGKGWQVFGEPQGNCDGTYEAICARSTDEECLLPGHHDARGAVIGNEFAGWLVLQLNNVKDGIIVIKLHTWHWDKENTRTEGWKTVNNERRLRVGESGNTIGTMEEEENGRRGSYNESVMDERDLMRSYSTPENLPDTFTFDYAINGKITSLNKAEFLQRKKQVQRVVETLTLLDDKDFAGGEGKDVEVAIRMRGCGRLCVFGISHIYWA